MDKENIIYIIHTHNRVLFTHKEEWNHVICKKIDGIGNHQIKWNKPDTDNRCYVFYFICGI
jgi:hypothetical protein